MDAILKVLLKSFLLAKGKFILCVLAAVLSSWGISMVTYSYFMSERDFKENFAATLPPDLILTVKGNTDQILEIIKSDPDVTGAENREALSGRIKNKSGSWMSLILFVASDPGNSPIGKVKILSSTGAVDKKFYIERNALSFLNTADLLTVQFPGMEVMKFSFGGTSYDPGLPPAQMDQVVFAYSDFRTALPVLSDNSHRFIIRLKDELRSVEKIEAVSARITKRIESKENHVISKFIPPPGKHPHQNIVDGISFLQKSFGASLSILGVILLSLILITWLYPQVATIGISKAIGASSSKLFKSYTLVLIIIISLGALIGLPLGFQSAVLYNKFVAFLQNFIPVKDPFPWYVHAQVILVIFALPLAITVFRLARFSAKSVHDSISQVFYTPYKRMFKLSQNLFSDAAMKYSFNNLFRNNQRTLLLLILLFVGFSLLITGFNLKYSLQTEFQSFVKSSPYNVLVSLKDSINQKELEFMKDASVAKEYSLFRTDRVSFKSMKKAYLDNGVLTTYSPQHKFNPELIIQGQIQPGCTDCIYLGQKLLSEFEGIKPGELIELKNKKGQTFKYKFSGVIKDLGFGASLYRINESVSGYYTNIAINKNDLLDASEAMKQVDDVFLSHNIEVRNVTSAESFLTTLDNHLKPTYLIIQVMGYATTGIALIGLMIVLSLSLHEREREIGIMKAIGSSSSSIAFAFQREFFLITVIAMVAGLIGGNAMNAAICKLFGVMLIESAIPPLTNLTYVALTMLLLIAAQIVTIQVYISSKVRRSSNHLLTRLF
ncbi:hypothetical protein WSM22_33140 [Cytophagales bacterium WSM2-2]|nr:hypothetical protein WSM22_33140 [Cytophagales bacterium WSM2-2]